MNPDKRTSLPALLAGGRKIRVFSASERATTTWSCGEIRLKYSLRSPARPLSAFSASRRKWDVVVCAQTENQPTVGTIPAGIYVYVQKYSPERPTAYGVRFS
jgi:hypothetical protein